MIASLDPLRGQRVDRPLTADEIALRDRIMATGSHSLVSSTRRAPTAQVLLTAAVILVAFVLVWPWVAPSRAVALTPAPLQVSPLAIGVDEVIDMAQRRLTATSGPAAIERRTHAVGWYLHLDEAADGTRTATIAPEVTTFAWEYDGSGRMLVVAGVPYLADGSTPPEGQLAAPEPGTVLHDVTHGPGGFDPPPVDDDPGESYDDMRAVLTAFGVPERPSASALMIGIDGLFHSWTMTDAQHHHLLDMLRAASGLEFVGEATDRGGRPVIVLGADSTLNPDFRHLLLVSGETGRIVGTEDVRLAPLDRLPAGSVTAYTLWETE
ncbi:hypothetical protein GCM10022382_03370 [Microbacterium invictum]